MVSVETKPVFAIRPARRASRISVNRRRRPDFPASPAPVNTTHTATTEFETGTVWLSTVTVAFTDSAANPPYGIICANNPVNFTDAFGLAVGAPGTGESFIPVWGSGRQAMNDFQTGHYVWGSINTVVAVSDVFLVKAAATGIAKGAWKLGSNSWRATRAWMGKTGQAEAKQQVHHWAVPQGRWGAEVPDFFKNQPWNLMPMESAELHQAIHGWGEMSEVERLMYGTPDWFKALLVSESGRIGNELRDQGQDDCKK